MNVSRRNNRRPGRSAEAIQFAREQRRTANEFAEHVWQMLRDRRCRGQKFRREYPISPYTLDFCCPALKLVVEIDGDGHLTEQGRRHDEQRDRFLAEQGYQVLRVLGYDVIRDAASVRSRIEEAIDKHVRELPSERE